MTNLESEGQAMSAERRFTVETAMTAHAYGNIGVHVLSTPYLANELELVCVDAVSPALEVGTSTVGTELSFRHLAATPVGVEVVCRARLLEQDGRRMLFAVSATDALDTVAEGTHERYVVNTERFISKIDEKARMLGQAVRQPDAS